MSGDLNDMMVAHGISVWLDPNWWPESGVPMWLAGTGIHTVEGTYYSTMTGSDPASIEAYDTASGETPLEAVLNCIAKIAEGK